jgi:hypothetical protein
MSLLPSVKHVQPNFLNVNIKENIDEVKRKIIPNCTLKHSNQKPNILLFIGKFKEVDINIL